MPIGVVHGREGQGDEGPSSTTKRRRAYLRAASRWTYSAKRRPTATAASAFPMSSAEEDTPVVHPRPPHYHDQLFRTTRRYAVDGGEPLCHDDLDLNSSLPGVQGVEDSMDPYEIAVGMRSSSNASSSRPTRSRELAFSDDLDNLELLTEAQHKDWIEMVDSLLGGVLDMTSATHELSPIDHPSDKALWDLNALDSPRPSRSSVTPGMSDLADSELSAESELLPSTPKASSKKSYARAVFADQQGLGAPIVLSPLPSKPLSASALAFIPAFTPMRDALRDQTNSSSLLKEDGSPVMSPTYEFHFPSLDSRPSPSSTELPRSLSTTLQKDENGFYVSVSEQDDISQYDISPRTTPPRRASATFLPSFLADSAVSARIRHTSKTREIVDRLRSMTTREASSAPHKHRKPDVSHLRLSLSTPTSADASTAADQAQSSTSANADHATIYESDNDGWITGITTADMATATAAAATAQSVVTKVDENGWIEGVIAETTRPRVHKRTPSSISAAPSSSSVSASLSTFSPGPSSAGLSVGFPTTPGAVAGPPYAACGTAFAPFAQTGFVHAATPAMVQAAYMRMQLQWQQAQAQAQAQAQWRLQMVQPHGLGLNPMYPSYAPYTGPSVMQGRPLGPMAGQALLQRTR